MQNKNNNTFTQMENQELIQKLIDNGYGHIVDAFLLNDNKVYTRSSRVNKSGACRVLNCKPKDLEDAMKACRELLQKELSELEK